jgi:hypothetical protein
VSKVVIHMTRIPEPGLKEGVIYELLFSEFKMIVRAGAAAGCAYITDWLLPTEGGAIVDELVAAAVIHAKPHKPMLRITTPLADYHLLSALKKAGFTTTFVNSWRHTVEMTKRLA